MFAAALLFSFASCGQSGKDVPQAVKSAFTQKFSGATSVKWGRESDKEWEAEFQMGGKKYSANFDNDGVWMETEYEVTVSELPAAVKAALDKESAGFKIKETAVTETVEGKAYEFVISKRETKMELVIDTNGNVRTKKQLKKEEEED